MGHALIVEDDADSAEMMAALIASEGFTAATATSLRDARRQLALQEPDIVLLDLVLPDGSGMELFNEPETLANTEVVLITGHASLETSIQALRLGAADYLIKPVNIKQLQGILSRVMRPSTLKAEIANLRAELERTGRFGLLWGRSAAMQRVYEQVARVSGTAVTVLITGESGTGKELLAQAIHRRSRRGDYNFQIIDCTAIPEMLFESIVFGHAKGSFTGAVKDQEGLLKRCDEGTAFLDEIGELPLSSQAKLLRAVQQQTFVPVGKTQPVHINTRFISATNRDLEGEIAAERFRRDLYYRLGVIHLELPPLREREDDVVLLAESFLADLRSPESPAKGFSDEVLAIFRRYSWPGNIRELRNVVERAIALAPSETIQKTDLPKQLRELTPTSSQVSVLAEISREEALDAADHQYLTALLEKHGGNVAQAARQAGVSRQGLHKLLSRHGINADDFRS